MDEKAVLGPKIFGLLSVSFRQVLPVDPRWITGNVIERRKENWSKGVFQNARPKTVATFGVQVVKGLVKRLNEFGVLFPGFLGRDALRFQLLLVIAGQERRPGLFCEVLRVRGRRFL